MKLKLTKELFNKGVSSRGACSKAQFEVLGVAWPLESGWFEGIIGKEYDIPTLEKFLALKDKHLPEHKRKKKPMTGNERFAARGGIIADPTEKVYVDRDPSAEKLAECPFDL